MSDAKKCDRCGTLYEPKRGSIALDVHICTGNKKGEWNEWSEVDFCSKCGAEVRKAIGQAIRE